MEKRKTEIIGEKIVLRENRILFNKHFGKRCFIIGNGPSLKKHDLTLLSRELTFVVNSFHLHKDFKVIDPTYYVFADPLVNKIDHPEVREWWKEIGINSNSLATEFIVPLDIKESIIDKEYLKDRKKYYLDISLQFNSYLAYKFDPTIPVHHVQNVIILSIQLAIFMGCVEIVLLGVDHDWLSNHKVDTHFYDGNAKISNASKSKEYPYHWWLNAVNTKFLQYKTVKEIAEKKGVKIFNASEAGVLDVFPMVPLSNFLRKWD